MPHISVVIPVYKAGNFLKEFYGRLKSSLESITDDFEIIMVEDCGGDRSWEIIRELQKEDKRLKGIQFTRNFGQHYGITAGLDHCKGDWVVVMDCDMQDRPEEIPRLYAKAQEGQDMVLAVRTERQHSFYRRATSWLFYKVFSYLTDMDYDGRVGNFRIMSKKVVEQFCQMREQLRFFGGLLHWMGFPAATLDVSHGERCEGKSTYTFRKLWKLAMNTIIAYSDKPLRLCVRLGFTLSFLSVLFAFYIIYKNLMYGVPVLGWSSLMVSLYFIGGAIIATLGIIGIYIGKAFDETKKRPLYIISKKLGLE